MQATHRQGPAGEWDDRQRPEFYLGTSEKDVMQRLSRLLKQQGYLGIAGMDGTTTFYLDPAAHAYRSVYAIHTITEKYARYSPEERHDLSIKAEQVLDHFGFNPTHNGYVLLRHALLLLLDDYRLIRPITKGLYQRLADLHHMEVRQVERNIRYAVSRSDIRECNSLAIHRLMQAFTLLCAGTDPERLFGASRAIEAHAGGASPPHVAPAAGADEEAPAAYGRDAQA